MSLLRQPQYPQISSGPSPLIDLSSRAELEQLRPAALKGFFNIVDRWKIRDEDARYLLRGISNGPYYAWKKQSPTETLLSTDVLTRISYVVGIFKALHIVYGEKLADEWVRLPNTNRIFGGETPLAYMNRGGIPAMQVVRRLLDARRGGA